MKDLKKIYDRYRIKICLICNDTSCYGLSEKEREDIIEIFGDVKELSRVIEFEGGIFTKNDKKYVVVKHGKCFVIALGDDRAGVIYYRLKRSLGELL